jgi:hypothetical protein
MKLTPEQERALVAELPVWNGGKGISLDDWANCTATPEQLIGASRILWPEFIEYDGCVFDAARFGAPNYEAWFKSTKGNRGAIERVVNHVHIVDLFGSDEVQPSYAQVVYLENVIAQMLRAKLALDFPGRHFTVSIASTTEQDDLTDHEVTFWQPAND